MGRPVRYGGEKGGVEERIRAMVALAEEALRPYYPPDEGRLPPLHRARAGRRRDGHRAVELSLSHRGQHHRARPDRRQRRDPEARRADAARRRAFRRGVPARRPAEGPVPQSRPVARADREAASARAGSTTSTSPARSPAAGPSSAPRPAPSRRSGSSSAARTRPMCAPTPSSITRSRTSSTAPSTIPANAAAASSASMSMPTVYDDFVEGFADLTRKYVVGNPLDAGDHARADGARALRRHGARARSPRRCARAPRRSST